MSEEKATGDAFGRAMHFVGWVCVIGIAFVIVEMVTVLPYLQDERARTASLKEGQCDLRGMGVMDLGPLGWIGTWGYVTAFAWIPLAIWRASQAGRRGLHLGRQARVLLVLVPTLFLVVQALLRLTPLRYGYPLV
jgi:hypothetical protein